MPAVRPSPADPLDDPALRSLMSASLLALARKGELRRHRRGTLLIEEGDVGDTLHLIVSGRLRAFSAHPSSGREFTFGVYGPGEYVGEMGLDGDRRSASVITLEPSQCVAISRATLMRHLHEDPPFAFELLAKVIRRARAATVSARQMALNDVYGRLRALLDTLAEAHADGTRVVRALPTHQELANRLGCTREMVTRLFADLRAGGYVEQRKPDLLIARPLPPRW
jgi:CRP/FNR family transcriptional regulator, cyclic AMP receptor protein